MENKDSANSFIHTRCPNSLPRKKHESKVKASIFAFQSTALIDLKNLKQSSSKILLTPITRHTNEQPFELYNKLSNRRRYRK
jgi:hypothetical protein